MTNKIETLRQKIARNYCRSILWVDDEIRLRGDYPDPNYNIRYRNFFLPVATALQAEGVLCQLQPVSPTEDPDSEPEELAVVKQLSKVADAVLLDWHLAGDDARHSTNIIRHLLEESETRFILILTQHSNALAEFKSEFNENLADSGGILHLGMGKHVAILSKPTETPQAFASHILAAIVGLMTAAYSDYVHWAALEIAGGIKKYTPKWLESLPRGMDWALLSEYCHSKEATAELILENLLEDLAHCIPPNGLESTQLENCKGDDWGGLEERMNRFDGIEDDSVLSLLKLEETPPDIKNGLPVIFEESQHEILVEFIKSQSEFTTFCENISSGCANNAVIFPGSVFKKRAATGCSREIFVCVSQACDCIRAKELMFIRGKRQKLTKLGSTIVEFQGNRYRFDAEGKNLQVIKIENIEGRRTPENFEKIGQLRSAITRRLSSRFWNYATRSAVNHSAFTRAERRGE
jgi:hypothetical protein